jgi:hypothetical protein
MSNEKNVLLNAFKDCHGVLKAGMHPKSENSLQKHMTRE